MDAQSKELTALKVDQRSSSCATGPSLPRDYVVGLDPLQTVGMMHTQQQQAEATPGLASASTSIRDWSSNPTVIRNPHQHPLHMPKSFLSLTGAPSSNPIPRQSIAKALASVRPPASPPYLQGINSTGGQSRLASFAQLSPTALVDVKVSLKSPSTARFASFQSPCFFHKRFDDAVNIDRVLEEIEDEGEMSSCRLMQTATSVREISKQLQRRPIKRAVRSVMIVTKARDNSLVYLTRELALWLLSTPRYNSELGVVVYVDSKLRASRRFDAPSILAQNPAFADMLRYWDPDFCWSSPEKFDLVLTLGGDGTVLFTSFSLFQRIVPPVLAFSLGSLGFLTNFEFASYKSSLDRIMGDAGMRVNLRMRFTCTVFRAEPGRHRARKFNPVDTGSMVEGEQFEVLNELVIDRGPSPYVSNLELYGDDELLTVVQADGCIFSTPTGSTAYSLSAGGPLTHPSIPGLILTPICPHTLSFRPMILSDSLLLKVCVPRNSRSTAYASFDGKHRVELRRGDCVQVEAGRYPFPTVVGEHGTGGEWFESVRRALKWNTRGAMQKSFSARSKGRTGATGRPRISEEDTGEGAREEGNDDAADAAEDEVEGDGFEEDEVGEDEDEEWDIDFDPVEVQSGVDSGLGASERSSNVSSPRRGTSKIFER